MGTRRVVSAQGLGRFWALRQAANFTLEELEQRLLFSSAQQVNEPNLPIRIESQVNVAGSPNSLSPQMVRNAYGFNTVYFDNGSVIEPGNGAGETIAIIDAYGDPNIINDLQTFDAQWGISNNDSSGNFALTVEEPQGIPTLDPDWSTETALDVEWAHAIAPGAHIDLVLAQSNDITDLISAVDYARNLPNVSVVSMSLGTSDFDGEQQFDGYFSTPLNHTGVTFIASSGDDGTLQYPSSSPDVIGVGGTTLNVTNNGTYIDETAWPLSGGGSSTYEGTTTPLVAYDADPATGFWIYDSVAYQGNQGWETVGGTSAGAPQWAALFAIANQGLSLRGQATLDGRSQSIPDLNMMPKGDFNYIGANDNTGKGSPKALDVIGALVGGNITVNASSLPYLQFVTDPSSTTAGDTLTPNVSVEVLSPSGTVMTSYSGQIDLSLTLGPQGAVLYGPTVATVVNGVADFTGLSVEKAGTYELQATTSLAITGTSTPFDISAGPPSQLNFTSQPPNAWQYGPITPGIGVALEDRFGNPVTTDSTVNIAIGSGPSGAVLAGTTSIDAVNGQGTFNTLYVNLPGTYTLEATDGSFASIFSNSFQVVAVPYQRYLFNGAGVSGAQLEIQQRRNALLLAAEGPPNINGSTPALSGEYYAPAMPPADDAVSPALAMDSTNDDAAPTYASWAPPSDAQTTASSQVDELLLGDGGDAGAQLPWNTTDPGDNLLSGM